MKVSSPCATILYIGGVALRVLFANGPPGVYEVEYRPFLSPWSPDETSSSAINIEVLTERIAPSRSSVLFESGGAWCMQAEEGGYRLNFRRKGSGRYHTVVKCDDATTDVHVYTDQDVDSLRTPSQGSTPAGQMSPVRYPLDQLLLMNHLVPWGGVVVHGAGVVIDGRALVLPGPSGAGKSTIAGLFAEAGLTESLLSDDRVILRSPGPQIPGGTSARGEARGNRQSIVTWGTPWPGDARMARNESAPLDALLFLTKADTTELQPLSPAAAARRLMPVVTCPWYDPDRLPGVLETCSRLVENAPCFELRFRADAGLVEFLVDRSRARKGGSN